MVTGEINIIMQRGSIAKNIVVFTRICLFMCVCGFVCLFVCLSKDNFRMSKHRMMKLGVGPS